MPYSTHAQLVRLLDDIDAYTWQFTDLRFYGTGINDLQPSGIGKASAPEAISVRVFINRSTGAFTWFTWSDDGGATWRTPQETVVANQGMLVYEDGNSLDYGIRITFENYNVARPGGDYWAFIANPPDSSTFRDLANDWVNINLERTHPVPFVAPVETVQLTEATYAIYLILRANNDPRSDAFLTEAHRLLNLLMGFRVAAEIPAPARV